MTDETRVLSQSGDHFTVRGFPWRLRGARLLPWKGAEQPKADVHTGQALQERQHQRARVIWMVIFRFF